jgi:hypothetical protein
MNRCGIFHLPLVFYKRDNNAVSEASQLKADLLDFVHFCPVFAIKKNGIRTGLINDY